MFRPFICAILVTICAACSVQATTTLVGISPPVLIQEYHRGGSVFYVLFNSGNTPVTVRIHAFRNGFAEATAAWRLEGAKGATERGVGASGIKKMRDLPSPPNDWFRQFDGPGRLISGPWTIPQKQATIVCANGLASKGDLEVWINGDEYAGLIRAPLAKTCPEPEITTYDGLKLPFDFIGTGQSRSDLWYEQPSIATKAGGIVQLRLMLSAGAGELRFPGPCPAPASHRTIHTVPRAKLIAATSDTLTIRTTPTSLSVDACRPRCQQRIHTIILYYQMPAVRDRCIAGIDVELVEPNGGRIFIGRGILVEPNTTQNDPKRCESAWDDLANLDATIAYQAIWRINGSGPLGVRVLRDHLGPIQRPSAMQLARCFRDLDADDFSCRQAAFKQLLSADELIKDDLKQFLATSRSHEVRGRLEELIAGANCNNAPHHLQSLRAIEALECAATPEARQLLSQLASGNLGSSVTRVAKAVLERIDIQQLLQDPTGERIDLLNERGIILAPWVRR